MSLPLSVTEEVAEGLRLGRPVVGLETTLVSHGFSGGLGLHAALDAEREVRAAGATPATVGVLDGLIRVGLTETELARFADAGPAARKVGARDLAACVVQHALGATTVGGTLAVCRAAGIRFAGTGGIGGVHRGYAQHLDVSADLPQLAGTPALVVRSGPKSMLDVGATAELLETLGVPVLGWQTSTLPRFYAADGGPPVSVTVSEVGEAAQLAAMHWQLNPAGGIILARPPEDGLDIDALVTEAVEQVRRAGITGQAITPAVLTAIEELSGGRSVEVNRRLIAGNARLAARVAAAHCDLLRSGGA